jgi:hypothetical protein
MVVKTQSREGNGWRVYAKNNSGTSQLLNAYAICLSGTGGVTTQVMHQVTVPGGSHAQSTVECPAGSVITGGGYASTDTMRVYNSSMSGNGWQAWADNLQGSGQLLNAYAVCLSGTGAAATQAMASVDVAAHDIGFAFAGCPGGQFSSGGGFALQNDLIVYNTSQHMSDVWSSYARNGGDSTRTMFVYGICLAFP